VLLFVGCGEPAASDVALTTTAFALNSSTTRPLVDDFVLVAVRDDGNLLAITSVHVGTARRLSERNRRRLRAMRGGGHSAGPSNAYCVTVLDTSNSVQARNCYRPQRHLHLPPRHSGESAVHISTREVAFARRLPLSPRPGSPFLVKVRAPDGRLASATGRQ
jgi:hypothetical protein